MKIKELKERIDYLEEEQSIKFSQYRQEHIKKFKQKLKELKE
jgi:hypothetical protein